MRKYLVGCVLAAAACTSSTPPGFSGAAGDRWTFPLIAPLENGLLLAPVAINTHGPYVFALDPDAEVTAVDAEVLKTAELRTVGGPHRLDESDTQRPRVYAEAIGFELGTLLVERRDVMVMPQHAFDVAGRRIHGIIGKDVLADSLVLGVDRDLGIGYLITQKAFTVPAGAVSLRYSELKSQVRNAVTVPLPRHLVKATIGGETYAMHLDLGAVTSQLRENLWQRSKLVAHDAQLAVIDEVGTVRRVTRATDPVPVQSGDATGTAAFVPYGEKRWPEQDVAGSLGLGFFTNYTVWANWHTKTFHLAPRTAADAKARLGRWDAPQLAKCQTPGCVTLRLVDPLNGAPAPEGKPHPGLVLSVARDPVAGGIDLEVVVEVIPAAVAEGATPTEKYPYLIINLPANSDRVIHQLKANYLGATLNVVDVGLFPRACPAPGGCIDQLAR